MLYFQLLLSMFFLGNDYVLLYQYYTFSRGYPRERGSRNDDNGMESMDRYQVTNCIENDGVDDSRLGSEIHDPSSVAIHIKKSLEDPSETGSLSSSSGPSYDSVSDIRRPGLMKSALVGAAVVGKASGMVTAMSKSNEVTIASSDNVASVLAWGCACFYLGSRVPQLYKNYKRKSVDGISPLLFGAALGGNIGYALCILTSCDFNYATDKHLYFWYQLPYILGSAGTLVFDVAYFYQRYIYRDSSNNTTNMTLEDWDDIVVRVSS